MKWIIVFFLLPLPVLAHEFWLDSTEFQVQNGTEVSLSIRNGELFDGSDLVYSPRRFALFDRWHQGIKHDVAGRLGDRPAVSPRVLPSGLHIFSYQSTVSTLTYQEWEKFLQFAKHKDFSNITARHQARNLPDTDFKELYTRFCKALVAVGDGAGADQKTGLETEFIALANPYVDPMDQGLPLQLLYQDAPRPNVQVELFERTPQGDVNVTLHRTDKTGRVTIPVKAGHDYLVDAVVLRIPSDAIAAEKDAVWETLWASLTFAVPQ
ncbi:DUF4198 domain-containing protein [Parasulfitobacter algicola]|uniref:DUF4198 domain-containing protein n=1 Tax=Parasulfitobacter algicola TaxID=2614809 RepID=A0ABX2IQI4_9RHOB|nr:DUF4198 domain-containing protein [Sulfitobacter algicola]NSX55127.1 DUF4198 domain-containing protein [Sulfitobacter algicola]